jgi:hypothetical protein
MALTFYDCTGDTTTSVGTGALVGTQTPPLGYRTPSGAAVPNNTETVIRIESENGATWEVCYSTITVSAGVYTYSRGQLIASSNSNARVSFGSGTKRIYYTVDAEHVTNDPRLRFASMTISLPKSDDDLTMMRTELEFTVIKLVGVIVGSSNPSIKANIGWSSSRSGSPTYLLQNPITVTSTTTGDSTITFANSVIPAGSYVRVFLTDKVGVITYIELNLYYQ